MYRIFGEIMNKLEYEICEVEEVCDLGVIDDYVFDVEMSETPHTFFANDILIHNSLYVKFPKKIYSSGIDNMLEFSTNVESIVNNSLLLFSGQSLNSPKNYLEYSREKICKTGFWTDVKKRYALYVVNDEGTECDAIKIMGLDVKKSSFPEKFKGIMFNVLDMILKNSKQEDIDLYLKESKQSVMEYSIYEVAKISSVKTIDEYKNHINGLNNFKSGVPQNTKAFIYNQLLDKFNCPNKYSAIKVGDKVKMVYLLDNPFRIDMIAFKQDDNPKEIIDYIEKYTDKTKMYERELGKKLQSFYDHLGWGAVGSSLTRTFF